MKQLFNKEEMKDIFKFKPFQLKRIKHQITIGCNRLLKEYERENRRTKKSTYPEEDY